MWETSLYQTTKVTLELRDIVDNGENSVNIWDFDYPSYYKGVEKSAFEQKVIDHYYFRQIGQETVGRFLHYFRARIREIMPYYIQLYESEALMKGIEDPFGNVDITETFTENRSDSMTGNTTGEGQSSSNGSGSVNTQDSRNSSENKTHRYSNTPQGSIGNLDNYLTEGSIDENTTTDNLNSTSNSSSEGSEQHNNEMNTTEERTGRVEHTYTKKGNQGVNTYAHDMKELRNTFLNIDMEIIEQLNNLFLGVY